jgi:uncharacterized protein (TIGR02099 family)
VVLRRTLHICWWTLAGVVVTLAVALSAVRLLLPGMSDYREQIESVAANVFKRPVSIGSLDAAWHMFSPVLKLNKVVVTDPQMPGGVLAIDEVEVSLDVVDSLLQRKLRTAGVKVIGTRLELDTDLRHKPRLFPLQAVLDWLLAQDSVALEKVQLTWRDPGLFDAPVRFSDLSARLVNAAGRHQVLLEGKLPMSMGDTVKIAADLRGRGSDVGRWRGSLYFKATDFQLSALRPAIVDTGMVAGGSVNLELWLGLGNAQPVWGSGHLAWQKPAIRSLSADAQGVSADSLSADVHWREQDGKWRVGISRFAMQRDARPVWPDSRLDLVAENGDKLRLHGKASLLVLDELHGWLPLLPWADNDALAMLDRVQPSGLLRDAEFEFRYRAGEQPQFAVRAAIENLTLAANGGLPGVTGVSGRVEGNLQAGRLQLDTSRAQLVAPRVFAQPLRLTRLSGDVDWQRFGDRFRVATDRLRIESGPLQLDSRWQLDWFYDQAAPWLDLQLAADELPLTAVRDYLPAGVMPAAAVSWLQQAFLAGSARHARVLLQGRLDQMPFDQQQGRFEARFDFDGVGLAYHPGWGQLDELAGQAVFSGRSMRVTGDSARIQDSPVERVVAVIDNLNTPMLAIDGTVGGTLAGMLEYVRSSALKERFGSLVESIDARGDARLQLHLGIPLKHTLGTTRVTGDVTLEGNDLLPRQSELGLTGIVGTLHFTQDGVSVKKARARLLGQPVGVSVYRQGKAAAAKTVVDIQGRLQLVDLLRQKQLPLATWLSGDTGWQVLLLVQNQAVPDTPRLSVELHSGLQGVAVTLPPPFAKPAEEKRAVTIRWVPGKEAEYPVQISYGDLVKASVLLTPGQRLRKATVHFGERTPVLPAHDELHLSGRLAVLDLGQWLPVVAALDSSPTGAPRVSPSVDLSADVLQVGALQVNNISAHSKNTDPWYFQIDGDDAKGWLRWIRGNRALPQQLLAKLDTLRVSSAVAAESQSGPVSLQPEGFPELNVEIGDLHWGERDLGQLTLVSRHTATGVHFPTLKMDSAALNLEGSGDWLAQDGTQLTRFDAAITGGSLEKLSELLGSGGSIKGGKLTGRVQLGWAGSPADFSLAKADGELDLEAKDGRLENVDEGAGKLLSLVSLNSLQRRLNLDFRDVVKEGFSFDLMKARFAVMDGDAFTDDFAIDGTSVKIDIAGRTGLVARDYDQLVTVTPQLASTLPIAGAIAGGPAVGAAVYLADKLVGDRFNRLTQVQYRVTGSWDKPVYTKLKRAQQEKQ